MSHSFRQVCVLLRDGRVLTDPSGRLRWYEDDSPVDDLERRSHVCGDRHAVLVTPQRLVDSEPVALLSVFGSRGTPEVPGTWVALEDATDPDPMVLSTLRQVATEAAGPEPLPPRRPAWFTPAWYDEADAWIDGQLAAHGRARTGPTVAAKVWSLSAVLRVPVEPAPVWFKASHPHFRAEPALTRLVAALLPGHAPTVLGVEEQRGWLLTDHLAGADEERQDAPPPGLGAAAAEVAATLQLRTRGHVDRMRAVGVPGRGLEETVRAFDEILAGSVELDELTADELAAARATAGEVHAVVEELAAIDVPETLVHGDLHPGNVALDGGSVVLYDWSDAAVSHPFLDLVHLTRAMSADEATAARARYLEVWRAAYPDLEIERGLELAGQVNSIYQTVTFERIYRAQEDASYWEMRGVVSRTLRRLPEMFGRPS